MKKERKPGDLLWAFDNYPAVNVSWYDVIAFCRWLSAKCKLTIRLPAEWEWQWAAIDSTGQDYPWGDEWHPARVNCNGAGIGRTVAIGLYPLSRGPFGVDDMAGNIWQWWLNAYDQPNDVALMSGQARVVRGGSWYGDPDGARSSVRNCYRPDLRFDSIGFRVLCESPIVETLPAAPLNAEKLTR